MATAVERVTTLLDGIDPSEGLGSVEIQQQLAEVLSVMKAMCASATQMTKSLICRARARGSGNFLAAHLLSHRPHPSICGRCCSPVTMYL